MKVQNSRRVKTQIKVCGFTRPADALAAVELGVDALGLVFYPPSPRNVSIAQACEVAAAVAPFTTITALFLDADASAIDQVLEAVPVSLLQFHGTETGEFCRSFKRPYIKSVPMGSTTDVAAYCSDFDDARGFLLDSNLAGAAGGSGDVFDWSLVPADTSAPVILAGGLGIANIRQAVLGVQPGAVDVSSGVESAKGIKDAALMQQFINEVHAADDQLNGSQQPA